MSPRALRGALFVAAACGACATANPILSPARVLAPGRLALDVGTAYVRPAESSLLDEARAVAAGGAGGSAQGREALVRAALVYGATPPGVAPYVAGRIGMGNRMEGSVALVGRVARAGVRRVLWSEGNWSLAGAVDGRVGLLDRAPANTVPGLALADGRLYGGDAVVMLGYVRRDIYDGYLALRGGYVHGVATMAHGAVGPEAFEASVGRVEVGATVGARIAFGHAGVGVELEVVYARTSGSGAGVEVRDARVVLVPAGAVSYQF